MADSKDLSAQVDSLGDGVAEHKENIPAKVDLVYGHGIRHTLEPETGTYWQLLARRKWLVIRCSIIYLAVLNVGFDLSVTGTTLGMPSFRKYFGKPNPKAPDQYIIPAIYQSAWSGGTFGGQIATDLIGGWLADRYGRKPTLMLSVLVTIIASTIQVTATNIGQIIAGKTVFGAALGLYISFVTSYAAELAPVRLRGPACMGVNFGLQVGLWIGGAAALGLINQFPDIDDSRSFRVIFTLQYIFAVLFLAFAWLLPESPAFHILRGNTTKATAVIKTLYGPDYDADRHVKYLTSEIEAERELLNVGKSVSYVELLKGTNLLRMMISACIIWPQLMGTSFWPSYQTYYFELAGATNPQAMNYGCTSVAIGTSILAFFLIETIGRRKLWIIGAAGMTCANLIGGFMYFPFTFGNKSVASGVATAMVFLWNGFYDIGPANMGYALVSEVPTSRLRAKNNAFVHVGSHLTGFGLSWAIPYMYNPDAGNLGLRMGLILGAFSLCFVVWGWFFIPETRGRNFYEIDQLFEHKVPIPQFSKVKFDENDALITSSIPSKRRRRTQEEESV